jgi:iron complex outermembrane receptor protein
MATYNVARDVDFPSLAMDLRKDHTTLLKAEHTYKTFNKTLSKWQTSVYYSYVDHLMDNLLKDLSPRMMNASAPANTTSFGGRSEALIMHSDKIIYLGADYKKEEASGNRVRTVLMGPMAGKVFVDNSWQDGSIDKIGVFGELHGKVNGADYIVSVRIDNNRSKISDPSVEFESLYELDEVAQFNPSLSIGFKKDLHIGWLFGAWVARSQRSASLSERFINHLPIGLDPYEMVGNPNLNPEVNHQLDLSVTKVGGNVLVDVGVFGSYLTNMISSEVRSDWSPRLATSPGVRQFTNIDEAMLFGGEVRLGASFPSLVHHEIVAAYTYGQNVTLDEALPEIAPLDIRYHIGGVFGKNDVHPSMTLRHVVAQERVSTVFGENTSKAFTVVDLSLSLKPVNSISVEIGAQNLFDVVYYEHLSRTDRENARAIYSPGRNVYTRLSITF